MCRARPLPRTRSAEETAWHNAMTDTKRNASRPAARLESELRLPDLSTLVAIVRAGSVSGAARALGVTPSQVSKAIARLEQQLGVRLLLRSAHGVVPSDDGRRLMPRIHELLARVRSLAGDEAATPELTVAASAWLTMMFLPSIAAAQPGVRVRSLELPPGIASAWASGQSFDVVLTTGEERWPDSWQRTRAGSIRKALLGSPAAARRLGIADPSRPGAPIDPARLSDATFIAPIYGHEGEVIAGEDGCPLPISRRRVGHQTQTLALALELAARGDQVVYGPALSARTHVERGRLVEIPVAGWDSADPLFVVCAAERVRARAQREILSAVEAALEQENGAAHRGTAVAGARGA